MAQKPERVIGRHDDMKKILAALLTALMILALTACGNKTARATETAQATEQAQPEEKPVADPETGGKKIVVIYFSAANNDTVDAVSSATPRVGDVSATEYVANLIHARVGGDLVRIVPEQAYPLSYNDTADQAKQEQNDNARPTFTLNVDPEEYDVYFIGYPIWWYELPMILDTFFDTYDFSGKTIIPFNTHLGSRDGGTYKNIASLEPNATVLDGLAVNGERAGKADKDVSDWLNKLGY